MLPATLAVKPEPPFADLEKKDVAASAITASESSQADANAALVVQLVVLDSRTHFAAAAETAT